MKNEYQLSIIVPSRNEEFLKNTVENILENKRGETEIIVGLDGEWSDPPLEDSPDVKIIYCPESIGQRAMMNRCARLSRAKYVMKVDAHCSFDEGFDVKMFEAFKETGDNVTMVPIMRNLHAFDWKCFKCGKKVYQDKEPVCPVCGTAMKKKMLWRAKRSPNSTSYRFNSQLEFKYFGEYKKKQVEELAESMSLQGSCFMATRENYWEKELCDESWGSWGGQGAEVSAKTHTSGGKVIVNKTCWYAHMFRTKPNFSFPYANPAREQKKAKNKLRDTFLNNKWEKQIYPLSWVVAKFSPVPDWDEAAIKEQREREMKSDRSGVYSIKCTGDAKMYIGSTKKFSQRFDEHLRKLRSGDHKNEHLQRAWDKYGESSFEFRILRFCSENELLSYEQEYIEEYKEKVGWRNMFNMNPEASSSLGRKHSEESLAKMSRQQSGENNGFYGKKHTEGSRKKMSESLKGNIPWNKGIPHSEETKEKISIAQTGKEAWNKGLTKETDERVKEYADKAVGRVPQWENGHPKGMLGKHHTEESKRKIGDFSRDKVQTEEHKRKNSEAHKGKVFSEERRKNLSTAMKGRDTPRNDRGRFVAKETNEDIAEQKAREKESGRFSQIPIPNGY